MDDDAPRPAPTYSVGMPLDTLSVDELQTLIETLESEIVRLRSGIESKNASRDAADAVFKF